MRGFLITAFLSHVSCEYILYHDRLIFPERPEYVIIPKFDKQEVPHWKPGRGKSYIDLSALSVYSSCDVKGKSVLPPNDPNADAYTCNESLFEMLMFEAPTDTHWSNYWEDGYCCTQDLINDSKCSTLGTLIVPADLPGSFIRSTTVKSNEPADLFEDQISHHEITSSGQYVLLMAICDSNAAPVTMDGYIESLNPYGYLPADLFGDLPFYFALSCMYGIIGLTWFILCACYRDQLMPLQFWITAVLVIGMIETSLLFAHYLNWNDKGLPALPITIVGLIFGVTKRALSRILVQLVALGYGVVRPSLGEDMKKVLFLGGSYFVLSLIYTLVVSLPQTTRPADDSTFDILQIVVFALALVDTTFYIWIFTSINNLLTSLASRKQGVKYLLYRNFRAVLMFLLFCTCLWTIYGSIIFMNDSDGANNNWREKWSIDALWELIYFIIFIAIAVLWAPSQNSQRYAYSIELAQFEDDEEWKNAANAEEQLTLDDDDTIHGFNSNSNDGELDHEYGGRLHDEKDPFQGTGALDPIMANTKKA